MTEKTPRQHTRPRRGSDQQRRRRKAVALMHCQLRVPSELAVSEPSHSTNPDLVGSRKEERGDLGSRWGETRKDCGVSPIRGRVSTPWARGAALTWPVTASQEPVCPPVQPQRAPGHSRSPNLTAQGHFSGQRPPQQVPGPSCAMTLD